MIKFSPKKMFEKISNHPDNEYIHFAHILYQFSIHEPWQLAVPFSKTNIKALNKAHLAQI